MVKAHALHFLVCETKPQDINLPFHFLRMFHLSPEIQDWWTLGYFSDLLMFHMDEDLGYHITVQ